jgi:hypothetical protein
MRAFRPSSNRFVPSRLAPLLRALFVTLLALALTSWLLTTARSPAAAAAGALMVAHAA